ncbi:SCP-2 sterol transfer family protein [Psychrobacter sp. NC44]|uniref:SCP-2 sterol transfer family protein n=1 Tax=Psychrobacter sp. NC44 TaxID=2774130 RepID=UPI00191ABD1C|nr:SCP-2 sterol transfer family protein [Psychrobacter sp. NC44]
MAVFLTDEWFEQVEQMGNEAGELNLPPALANMIVNLKVSDTEQDIEANFANGLLHRGLNDAATTTLLLDRSILQSIITDFDTNEIMGAFMGGKIRVEGDMSQLMAVQMARPSAEQKELYTRIKSMTTMA